MKNSASEVTTIWRYTNVYIIIIIIIMYIAAGPVCCGYVMTADEVILSRQAQRAGASASGGTWGYSAPWTLSASRIRRLLFPLKLSLALYLLDSSAGAR